jgi:PAS domain-containing protein
MLNYNREDLIGKELSKIWMSEIERDQFISCIKEGKTPCKNEVLFISKDGKPHICLVSAILITNNMVFCSTIDINKQKISEDEIRHTLDDIERQVRERTVHLQNANEKLKAEIFEYRKFENQFIPRKNNFSRSEENWR